jgi:glyoxylase-like metal-dependent hydrolase (beta-lactamase superfamily II)
VEIFACIVGRSKRPYYYMFNLANNTDEIELVYPFWVIKEKNETVLIDTGFSERMAGEKGVFDYLSPSELLPRVGLDPKDVKSIVISHLHYDHFCVPERYPNATFYVQSDDIDYFTGRGVTHPAFKSADTTAIDQIGRLRSDGKIKAMNGDFNFSPSIKVLHVGGHTPGHQITVIDTGEKPLVLACDASHFYANLETRTPTSIIHNYDNYQRGFTTIETLAAGGRWFPGHDPKMLSNLEQVEERIYRVKV